MMALDMRALYYIALPEQQDDHEGLAKANENSLNQNFSIIADKIYELESRLYQLEQRQ